MKNLTKKQVSDRIIPAFKKEVKKRENKSIEYVNNDVFTTIYDNNDTRNY